jgi:hypothetical protein
MKALPTLAALLTTLTVAGCQQSGPYRRNSPYYQYPAGMHLSLLQPIDVPPASATTRLQFGRQVARNGVEETEPYCIFELDTVGDAAQRVAPERFAVVAVQRRVQSFAGLPAAHAVRQVGFDPDNGPSHLYFITEFRLRSADQPQVRALSCMSNQMAPGIAIMRHLTLAEIRQALGGYFAIDLPG